jgi:sugar lactone lactonase YvrE
LWNDRIRKVGRDGRISTVWTEPDRSRGIRAHGLAVDAAGSLYFAVSGTQVGKLTRSGVLSIVAGKGTQGFSGDGGPATAAELDGPYFLAADGRGNLYIADAWNGRIRRVSPDGTISTVAGGGADPYADGVPATQANLLDVAGIAVDASGTLYISAMGSVRKVTADGIIRFVALTSMYWLADEPPPRALVGLRTPDIYQLGGLAADPDGSVWVADRSGTVLQITPNPDGWPRGRFVRPR